MQPAEIKHLTPNSTTRNWAPGNPSRGSGKGAHWYTNKWKQDRAELRYI